MVAREELLTAAQFEANVHGLLPIATQQASHLAQTAQSVASAPPTDELPAAPGAPPVALVPPWSLPLQAAGLNAATMPKITIDQ